MCGARSGVKLFFALLACVAVIECVVVHLPDSQWTNSWAVGVSEDMTEKDIDKLAERYGFQNKKQVSLYTSANVVHMLVGTRYKYSLYKHLLQLIRRV